MSKEASIRSFLIAQVQWFVERACRLSGICRIALIGSLTTTKVNPKDADVLVWVEDNADLTPLAIISRQLKGRTQSRNRGADIFLANTRNEYVGRICQWRDCRPGIRAACQAISCGRRAHLYDDFGVLNLAQRIIQSPPLELWPSIIRRVQVPNDLEALVAALAPIISSRPAKAHREPSRLMLSEPNS
jgi:Family of unknown function (DUF6932)